MSTAPGASAAVPIRNLAHGWASVLLSQGTPVEPGGQSGTVLDGRTNAIDTPATAIRIASTTTSRLIERNRTLAEGDRRFPARSDGPSNPIVGRDMADVRDALLPRDLDSVRGLWLD